MSYGFLSIFAESKEVKTKGPAGIVGVPDDLWGRHLYTNCAKLKNNMPTCM